MNSQIEEICQDIYSLFVEKGFFPETQDSKDDILTNLTCIITNVKLNMRDDKDKI